MLLDLLPRRWAVEPSAGIFPLCLKLFLSIGKVGLRLLRGGEGRDGANLERGMEGLGCLYL